MTDHDLILEVDRIAALAKRIKQFESPLASEDLNYIANQLDSLIIPAALLLLEDVRKEREKRADIERSRNDTGEHDEI